MKTIYIAGPMTGKPLYNFPAFDAARDRLEEDGWRVISPADMDRKIGFDPRKDHATPAFMEEAIRRCLQEVLSAHAIYMLKGWEESAGATAEHRLALWRRIPVFFEPGADPACDVRDGILDIAQRVTTGDRRRDYDKATPNHDRIAGAWNWYLQARRSPEAPLSALDVAQMMILLKMARACFTPTKDSYVDMAGYARCASQIAGFEED